MEIHASEQLLVFLWMIVAGVCSSVVYDLFRISRKLIKMPFSVVMICDGIFWIVCTAVTFLFVMRFNQGELRWFVFAGILIGGVVYFTLLSHAVTRVLLFLLRIIVKICIAVRRLISFINKLFSKPKRFIKTKTARIAKYLKYVVKKPKSHLDIMKKSRKMKQSS